MEGFAAFKGDKTQPLSETYDAAASMVGQVCGVGWLNQTAAVSANGGGGGVRAGMGWAELAVIVVVVLGSVM